MADLAALGFSIDSKPLARAASDMDKLAGAAKRTEAAASGVGTAMAKTSTGLTASARAQERYMQQIQRTEKMIERQNRVAALSSHHMTNLGFQINDVATMLAMGQDPFRIMASQAGQFYQVLSQGEGGVRGSLGYLKDTLVAMVTPARLATAGLVTLGAAAVTAATSWARTQREIELALVGIGSAAGMTASDINRIAFEAAATGEATVGAARDMALQFAATGKIGAEMSAELIGLSRGLSKVYGEDAAAIGERLAKAFSDPVKGVEELNRRLAAFDAATVNRIGLLTRQGDRFAAQSLMVEGVERSIRIATETTWGWTKAWDDLTAAASRYWGVFSKSTAEALGMGDVRSQIESSWRSLEGLRASNQFGTLGPYIDREYENYLRLSRLLSDLQFQARDAALNMESLGIDQLARRIVPDGSVLSEMEADLKRLTDAMGNIDLKAKLGAEGIEVLNRALVIQRNLVRNFMTDFDRAMQDQQFAMRSMSATTAGERAQLAFDQTLSRLQRGGQFTAIEAQLLAMSEKAAVLKEAEIGIARAQRDRIAAGQDIITRAEAELRVVGANRFEQDRIRALTDARLQLENEALRVYGSRDAMDAKHLTALTDQINRQSYLNKLIAAENLAWDLRFDRDQLGRSAREQAVYGQLNSMGLLTRGQIADPIAEGAAAMVRYTDVMRIAQDAQKDFATGFIRDMRDGVSATEALANAMNRLADRMLDMAMDDVFSRLFAPVSQSIAAGATGWDASVFPAFHRGGIVGEGRAMGRYVHPAVFDGAPRYHTGGIAGLRPNEVPAILERGETVLPRGHGAASVSMPVTVSIDATGADPAGLARVEREVASLKSDLPRIVVPMVVNAMDRNAA